MPWPVVLTVVPTRACNRMEFGVLIEWTTKQFIACTNVTTVMKCTYTALVFGGRRWQQLVAFAWMISFQLRWIYHCSRTIGEAVTGGDGWVGGQVGLCCPAELPELPHDREKLCVHLQVERWGSSAVGRAQAHGHVFQVQLCTTGTALTSR